MEKDLGRLVYMSCLLLFPKVQCTQKYNFFMDNVMKHTLRKKTLKKKKKVPFGNRFEKWCPFQGTKIVPQRALFYKPSNGALRAPFRYRLFFSVYIEIIHSCQQIFCLYVAAMCKLHLDLKFTFLSAPVIFFYLHNLLLTFRLRSELTRMI